MTNEQQTALKLLLTQYAKASYFASVAAKLSLSLYNEALIDESMAEEDVLKFVDAMLMNASKDAASTVLDKSFWNG